MLSPDVVKLARPFLLMPAANISVERAYSGMKKVKKYLGNSTTKNPFNHCMVIHIHAEDVHKMSGIEIVWELIEYSQI